MDFAVMIDPVGKARPRVTRKGHAYTPAKTKNAEKEVLQAYREARGGGGIEFIKDTPVTLVVEAYMAIPKSYSKTRRARCENQIELPTKKPDADNILKLVMDALNGIAYADDSQVISATCRKYYTVPINGHGYLMIHIH